MEGGGCVCECEDTNITSRQRQSFLFMAFNRIFGDTPDTCMFMASTSYFFFHLMHNNDNHQKECDDMVNRKGYLRSRGNKKKEYQRYQRRVVFPRLVYHQIVP